VLSSPSSWRWLAGPIFATAFGLLIVLLAFGIRDPSKHIYGARFWPILIGGLLIAVNLASILRQAFVNARTRDWPPPATHQSDSGEVTANWLSAALVVAFPAVIQILGFLIGSTLFLTLFMRSLGYTRWGVTLPTAITFSVVVTYFFTAVAYTPLPRGVALFYELSVQFSRLVTAR
jgi:hypothetical protein